MIEPQVVEFMRREQYRVIKAGEALHPRVGTLTYWTLESADTRTLVALLCNETGDRLEAPALVARDGRCAASASAEEVGIFAALSNEYGSRTFDYIPLAIRNTDESLIEAVIEKVLQEDDVDLAVRLWVSLARPEAMPVHPM